MELAYEGTNNVVYKYGFGWIVLRVIFNGQKGQIW